MSNTVSQRYPSGAEKIGNALLSGFDRSMSAITGFIGPRVSTIISDEISKGIGKNIFSETDINNISLTEWKRRYAGYMVFSLGNVVGQQSEDGEMNWWALIKNKNGIAHVEAFDFSDSIPGPKEIYELITILKLINIHGSLGLHESSPIQIREKMLWLLKAHGIQWRFDKNQWNETGVYIFTK